jgi:hypothetical protein
MNQNMQAFTVSEDLIKVLRKKTSKLLQMYLVYPKKKVPPKLSL